MKTLLLGLALQAFWASPAAPDEAARGSEPAAAPRLAQLGLGAPAIEERREGEPGEGFSPAQLEQLRRMVARLMQAERREPPRGPEPRPGEPRPGEPRPGEHGPGEHGPEREVHYHYHYYHRGQHEEHRTEHHDSHHSVHYHYHYHYN